MHSNVDVSKHRQYHARHLTNHADNIHQAQLSKWWSVKIAHKENLDSQRIYNKPEQWMSTVLHRDSHHPYFSHRWRATMRSAHTNKGYQLPTDDRTKLFLGCDVRWCNNKYAYTQTRHTNVNMSLALALSMPSLFVHWLTPFRSSSLNLPWMARSHIQTHTTHILPSPTVIVELLASQPSNYLVFKKTQHRTVGSEVVFKATQIHAVQIKNKNKKKILNNYFC